MTIREEIERLKKEWEDTIANFNSTIDETRKAVIEMREFVSNLDKELGIFESDYNSFKRVMFRKIDKIEDSWIGRLFKW